MSVFDRVASLGRFAVCVVCLLTFTLALDGALDGGLDAGPVAAQDSDSGSGALLLLPPEEGAESLRDLDEVQNETNQALGLLPPAGVDEESAPLIDLARLSTMPPVEGGIRDDFWGGDGARALDMLTSSALVDPSSPALRRLLRRFLLSAPELPSLITTASDEQRSEEQTEDIEEAIAQIAQIAALGEDIVTDGGVSDDTDDQIARAHFLWRVEQLARFGMWKDLDRLLSLLPRSRLESESEAGRALLRLRLDAMILAGRYDDVCAEARQSAQPGAGTDQVLRTRIHRIQVACQIRDRDDDIALLGLDLLRETDIPGDDESPEERLAREEFFALASMRLGFGGLPTPLGFSAMNLFLIDGAEGVDLITVFAEDGAITAPALLGLAYGRHLVLSLRAGFAERATELGILAPEDLADFYESFIFDDLARARAVVGGDGDDGEVGDGSVQEGEEEEEEEEEDDHIVRAASFDGPEQRAYAWQAAFLLEDSQARSELARFALESARSEGLEITTAHLWRELLLEVTPEARLIDYAEAITRFLLLIDEGQRAREWTALLVAAQDYESDLAIFRLWPEARLAGLGASDLGDNRLDGWQEYALTATRGDIAAVREIQLRSLLFALSSPVPEADWFVLNQKLQSRAGGLFLNRGLVVDSDATDATDATDASVEVQTQAVGEANRVVEDLRPVAVEVRDSERASLVLFTLRRALDDAAREGRRGEALALLLDLHQRHLDLMNSALKDGVSVDPVALLEGQGEILRALRRIGFIREARERAREIWRDVGSVAALDNGR
ncbi:MAG: hypothetical protein OD811_03430 [Alphaproteobacteria bacterium]